MQIADVRWWLARAAWWVQKKRDGQRVPSDEEAAQLQRYYQTAMDIFGQLGVDVNAKPADIQKLYHMTLLYLDNDEVICPATVRTASLIAFLDTTDTGLVLPPASQPVTLEFAKKVDEYFFMEIFGNSNGLQDIHDELADAIARRSAQLRKRQ